MEAIDADLSGSTFSDVNLSNTTFRDVNLCGAAIENVDLSRVKITDCRTDGMTIEGILVTDLMAAYRK